MPERGVEGPPGTGQGPPRRLVSLLVPVFNEEENVAPLYEAVRRVMDGLDDRYEFELLFTDNHSTDRTFERIDALSRRDPRVRAVRFSRNFGYQRSIHAAYMEARGDAAIQLDCDLQDPPGLIPEFLKRWEEGAAVVYGVRRSRDEGLLMRTTRKGFYRVIDLLSEDRLPHDAGDFRLVDRRVIEVLRQMDDQRPYLRGAIATLGFEQAGVAYDRPARARGETKFRFRDNVALALDGILNHSVVPLRIATYTGLVVTALAGITLLYHLVGHFTFGRKWPEGFTTITILVLAGIGLNAMFLGVIGEYLGRIYQQVKRKPMIVVEAVIDRQRPSLSGGLEPAARRADEIRGAAAKRIE